MMQLAAGARCLAAEHPPLAPRPHASIQKSMRIALLLSSLFVPLAAAEIHGVVYDENGTAPVPNMGIFADGNGTRLTTTDEQGAFTVVVPAGQDFAYIVVWRDDVMGAGYRLGLDQFKDQPARIVVSRGVRVQVTVTDPEGHPLAGVKLDGETHGGTTDADGNAWFGPMTRSGGAYIAAELAGYEKKAWNNVPAVSFRDRPLVLVLKPLAGTKPPAPRPKPAPEVPAAGF